MATATRAATVLSLQRGTLSLRATATAKGTSKCTVKATALPTALHRHLLHQQLACRRSRRCCYLVPAPAAATARSRYQPAVLVPATVAAAAAQGQQWCELRSAEPPHRVGSEEARLQRLARRLRVRQQGSPAARLQQLPLLCGRCWP